MPAFSADHLVTVDANRTVKDKLIGAMVRVSTRRRISVTDLVHPRQAFFGRTRTDIEIPPERMQAMMAGTGFHDLFGHAISTEEYVEQLVEFEGIVGKVDIFEHAPLELKTTGLIPADPLGSRASQVEQLAMYCVMTGKPLGHLLYYQRAEYGRAPKFRAFDVEIVAGEPIVREMRRRRDLLIAALDRNDPSSLPRCEWLEKGCIYAEICGCGALESLPRAVNPSTVRVMEKPALAENLAAKIRDLPEPDGEMRYILNDLVFPRRAALRRDGVVVSREDEDDLTSKLEWMQRRGFLDVLTDTVWYGIPGASKRHKTVIGPIKTSILLFEGFPTLIRKTDRKELLLRERLVVDAPYYTDRLAMECALAGVERGRLIVYYARLDDKFMVYDIWFKDLDGVRVEMQKRLALLIGGAPVKDLPRCEPDWMTRLCDFGDACACREVS